MKRFLKTMTVIAALIMTANTAKAQDIYDITGKNDTVNVEKELSKQEQRMLQQRIDSVQWAEAMQAIRDTTFTLEADKVIFKYGQWAYVSSSTNFVAVNKKNATVQVAFNIPVAGPNGLGGVTLDGMVTDYRVETDRKGRLTTLSFNVMGVGISARMTIQLYKGSNEAQVDISPNFNSRRISLSGHLLPKEKSFTVKGMSI